MTNKKPDIVVVDKGSNRVFLVIVAIPNNNNMGERKVARRKKTNYAEIQQMRHAERVKEVPLSYLQQI